jgi:hypothetical protein
MDNYLDEAQVLVDFIKSKLTELEALGSDDVVPDHGGAGALCRGDNDGAVQPRLGQVGRLRVVLQPGGYAPRGEGIGDLPRRSGRVDRVLGGDVDDGGRGDAFLRVRGVRLPVRLPQVR